MYNNIYWTFINTKYQMSGPMVTFLYIILLYQKHLRKTIVTLFFIHYIGEEYFTEKLSNFPMIPLLEEAGLGFEPSTQPFNH